MTTSVDLQKSIQKTESVQLNYDALLAHLSRSKNCGVLILINKLLQQGSGKNSCRLAENLLELQNHPSIAVHPSKNDNPCEFVTFLIQQARQIAGNASDSDKIRPYAKKFIEKIETFSSYPELDKMWQDFTFIFFKEKLIRPHQEN